MKILQVNNVFSPVHGGSAEVPYHLSKELARKGHEVTVYTSDSKLTQEHINFIPEVCVHAFRTWLASANLFVSPGIIKKAKEETAHFDIIHMHSYRTFQNVVIHHYAKKYDIPYVLQAHGSLATFFQKRWLKRTFDAIWGYRILEDASKVIALTNTEAEQYKSMGLSEVRIEVVPNGIDSSEFSNLPGRGEFRGKYSLNDSQKVVLYLGRIHQTKGIDLLAKAFAGLTKEFNEAKLVVVGPDDGYLPALKQLIEQLGIEERVVFTGPLYERDKLEAYVDADVFVTPSFHGFPVTFLEACACGIPVVTTEKGDKLDWMHDQVGYVTAYEQNELRNAVAKVLSDVSVAEQFRERGQTIIKQRFTWSKIVEQVEHTYLKCLRDSA